MSLLSQPAVQAGLAGVCILPLGLMVRRLHAGPLGKFFYPRLMADSLIRGLAITVLALALVLGFRQCGLAQEIDALARSLAAVNPLAVSLPGLLCAAFLEEGAKFLGLICLPFRPRLASSPHSPGDDRTDKLRTLHAAILAGMGAGLVVGLAESLMYAAAGLHDRLLQSPGAVLIHLGTTGLLARYRQEDRILSGFVLALVIHVLFNFSVGLPGIWQGTGLLALGLLLVLVLAEPRDTTGQNGA